MSKKRAVDSESPSENESAKKRMVTIATVKKWIVENDKDISTSTWLVYDTSDREHVSAHTLIHSYMHHISVTTCNVLFFYAIITFLYIYMYIKQCPTNFTTCQIKYCNGLTLCQDNFGMLSSTLHRDLSC